MHFRSGCNEKLNRKKYCKEMFKMIYWSKQETRPRNPPTVCSGSWHPYHYSDHKTLDVASDSMTDTCINSSLLPPLQSYLYCIFFFAWVLNAQSIEKLWRKAEKLFPPGTES